LVGAASAKSGVFSADLREIPSILFAYRWKAVGFGDFLQSAKIAYADDISERGRSIE
jgi:hypothetical protein